MRHQVHDIAGVLLQSSFEFLTPDGRPTFTSLKVLDGHYRPTGPDLLPMLMQSFIHTQTELPYGVRHDCVPYMNVICAEVKK